MKNKDKRYVAYFDISGKNRKMSKSFLKNVGNT